MTSEEFLKLHISLLYLQAGQDALREALSKCALEVHGESLGPWVDRRQGELAYESLCRVENSDPAYSAYLQAMIDETKAKMHRCPE